VLGGYCTESADFKCSRGIHLDSECLSGLWLPGGSLCFFCQDALYLIQSLPGRRAYYVSYLASGLVIVCATTVLPAQVLHNPSHLSALAMANHILLRKTLHFSIALCYGYQVA
jgi:hypothetical protein